MFLILFIHYEFINVIILVVFEKTNHLVLQVDIIIYFYLCTIYYYIWLFIYYVLLFIFIYLLRIIT